MNNRPIKFRGQGINGEWYYGLLAHQRGKWYISNSVGSPFAYEVRPETIGQFTGLLDKNGVEIYEGDIVRLHEDDVPWINKNANRVMTALEGKPQVLNEDDKEHIIPVEYVLCYWLPFTSFLPIATERWEVIGNIYENPELLTR